MSYNMNWRVAVRGEKHTYPQENRLVLVYTGGNLTPCVFRVQKFIENNKNRRVIDFTEGVFWQYVDKLPTHIKANKVVKCGKKSRDCEFLDDGYCFDKPPELICMYCEYQTDYYAYNLD